MDYLYVLNWISENDVIVFIALNMITIFLVIVGWCIVFSQNKKLMKNKVQMKIYEELYELRKIIDEKSIDLGVLLNPFSLPFLNMKSVNMNKSFDSSQYNLEALKIWSEYVQKIAKETSEFDKYYLKLWNHVDMWIGAMPELKRAKEELFEVQFKKLTNDLWNYQRYLMELSIKKHHWNEWDKNEIEKKAKKIEEEFHQIGSAYLDGFMVEVHNCLVSSILGYKKKPLENFKITPDKILTKKGIKETKK